MSEVNKFKKAVMVRLRFPSIRGPQSVTLEDLYSLPLTSKTGLDLDTIAKTVNAELKQLGEESFVNPSKTGGENEVLQLKLDILKEVIADKQAIAESFRAEKARSEEKQTLLDILHGKKQEALKDLSVEELEKRINEL